jgi:hypothetical protein
MCRGGTVFLGHTWVLLGLLLGPRICRNFAEPMVEPPAGSGLVGAELTRSARAVQNLVLTSVFIAFKPT